MCFTWERHKFSQTLFMPLEEAVQNHKEKSKNLPFLN